MSQKRVLLIDCQVLQTTALHRGMGKYTLAVLAEYRKLKLPYDEVRILLSESKGTVKDEEAIRSGLEGFEIVRLPLGKTNPARPDNYREVARRNRQEIDRYVNQAFENVKIDFLITSLFHEDGCSVFPTDALNKYLLVYDLIPLQFPHYYLEDPRGKEQYLSRFKEFFEATHYFTISETVANDLSLNLGVPLNRITPIYGSFISRKRLNQAVPEGFKKGEKFILMPTGDDARKNNLRAVMAFEEFNSKSGYAYKLAITSFFGDKTKRELMMQSNHIIFTGNIDETELAWLYDNAELVFFPSEYEGLGMPPLEAVEFNKPVLCSDITVFKEITDSAFYFCDPYSVPSMSGHLQRLLIKNIPKVNSESYAKILEKYKWSHTAQATIDAYRKGALTSKDSQRKKRIAIFAPSPSGYSAIGKVVQEQHYELSRMAEIDYYLEEGITARAKETNIRINYLPYVASTLNPWVLGPRDFSRYDQVIYHLGNSEYHVVTAIKALAFPDTVVLHDTNLSGMLDIVRNLGYITDARYTQEATLQEAIFTTKGISAANQKGNYIATLTNAAKKVITHSTYAQEAVTQLSLKNEVNSIKLQLPTPSPFKVYDSADERPFVIAYAGIIHEAKGIEFVHKMATATYDKPILIKLFGFSLIDEATKEKLQQAGNVELVLSPSDTRFMYELGSSDIVIGFRPDYHGETSLSTIEALRAGCAVVVNDVGWFSELPDKLVYKVSHADDIVPVIKRAMVDKTAKTSLAEKRLEYIKNEHSIHKYVVALTEG